MYNDKYSYIQETFREACEKMHIMGYLQMGHTHTTELKSNQTDSRVATLARQVDNDRSCNGSTYSDSYGT